MEARARKVGIVQAVTAQNFPDRSLLKVLQQQEEN
jgi:hypothetical protein